MRAHVAATVAWAVVTASVAAAGPRVPIEWRRDTGVGRGSPLFAVAAGPGVAVGDVEGVEWAPPGAVSRRVARTRGVADLAFGPDGALWIASARGLWRVSAGAVASDRTPGAGDRSRAVRRVSWSGPFGLVATASGAHATQDGVHWVRLRGPLSTLAVDAIGIEPPAGSVTASRTAGSELPADAVAADVADSRWSPRSEAGSSRVAWIAAGRDLWRARLESGDRAVYVDAARVASPPGRPLGEPVMDLATDWPDAALALLYPRHLALGVERPGAPASEWRDAGSEGDLAWRVISLDLPPGARSRRLLRALGRIWIAHDRGVSHAEDPVGPWSRASGPAARAAVHALAESGGVLYAASETGLLVARPLPPAAPSPPRPIVDVWPEAGADPDIRAVQTAAIRYLDLDSRRWRSRFRGLGRRGWVPTLSLDLDAETDRDRSYDDDQSFVSGDTRYLHDRDDSRGHRFAAGLALTWDFPSLAYDDDWDDLSREVRQLITLRDDVLDELNQLYFERQRVLLDLAARPPGDPESDVLRVKAEELAAGIDAWTGGWFGAERARLPHPVLPRPVLPQPVPPHPDEEYP